MTGALDDDSTFFRSSYGAPKKDGRCKTGAKTAFVRMDRVSRRLREHLADGPPLRMYQIGVEEERHIEGFGARVVLDRYKNPTAHLQRPGAILERPGRTAKGHRY